jgi:hypothetical protein
MKWLPRRLTQAFVRIHRHAVRMIHGDQLQSIDEQDFLEFVGDA